MKATSFRRSFNNSSSSSGTKTGTHGVTLTSSGILELDNMLGGGLPVGSVTLVLEDSFSPHHLVLLRYFLSQGIVHQQPIHFSSPLPEPKSFLGTLPALSDDDKSSPTQEMKDHGLRIAFQYKNFISEQDALDARRKEQQSRGSFQRSGLQSSRPQSNFSQPYCSVFDMRKSLERPLLASTVAESFHIGSKTGSLLGLYKSIHNFLLQVNNKKVQQSQVCRFAVQSLGAPQIDISASKKDNQLIKWFFMLKSLVQQNQCAALVTIPASTLSQEVVTMLQHLADVVVSLHSLRDDDKVAAELVSDFNSAVGLLRVIKLGSVNSLIPPKLATQTFLMKTERRRKVVLEPLQQSPVDLSPGKGTTTGCASGSSENSLDF